LSFFRRGKPLHEKLAEEGGMLLPDDPREESQALRSGGERALWAAGGLTGIPTPTNRAHPLFDVAGVHGIPRNREWDAVVTAEAPELPGVRLEFVALEDGTLFTDDDLPDDSLAPLADALESSVQAPYHALALRQAADVWSVAALRVEVVEVPEDVAGDKVDLAVNDGERTILVDDAPAQTEVPTLEQFAAQQFGSFVVHASRLDDLLWEVTVLPL
jgi:hypothetical protein